MTMQSDQFFLQNQLPYFIYVLSFVFKPYNNPIITEKAMLDFVGVFIILQFYFSEMIEFSF